MRRLRQLVRNYFGFSKTETNGFLVLVPLMVLMLFVPTIYVNLFASEYDPLKEDQKKLDSLVTAWNRVLAESEELRVEKISPEFKPVPFNPNTASQEELRSFGAPAFLTRRIDNYRSKGGKFRIKKDLSRIYDFPDSLYTALEPLILLPDALEPKLRKSVAKKVSDEQPVKLEAKAPYRKQPLAKLMIDLNTCDTTELKKLRGIGSGFSRRIVKYRDLLGGFTVKEQLKEVYGLSDSLYWSIQDQIFVADNSDPSQININIANFKMLNAHPYISYKQAGQILNTRSKKGKFRSHSDLLLVQGIDSLKAAKLAPYISF